MHPPMYSTISIHESMKSILDTYHRYKNRQQEEQEYKTISIHESMKLIWIHIIGRRVGNKKNKGTK